MKSFFAPYGWERINKINELNKFCLKVVENEKNRSIINLQTEFENLCNSSFISDLVNHELISFMNDSVYVPVPASFSFFTIFDCDYCSLFILSRKGSDFHNSLHCSPHSGDRVIASLNLEGILYNQYVQENPYPIDIIDTGKKLKVVGKNLSLNFGKSIFLRKNEDVFEYSQKNDSIHVLALYSKDENPFVWEYDINSLTPLKIVAGNYQTSSRIEHTCTLLGEINNIKSIDKLFNLLRHKDFNVRWESAKSIMWIDSERGMEALDILKEDPHPEIRKAINKSFQIM